MIDPEQDAFRRSLRARTRPTPEPDDDDWTPRKRWNNTQVEQRRKPGPPRQDNPSQQALAVRRYRERLKAQRQGR